MFQTSFIPQGWECPKCKRIYSPTTVMCSYCPQNATSVTTSGTTLTFTHNFYSSTPNPTAKSKCKICNREKWEHPEITYT